MLKYKITFHGLRHTPASILIAKKVDIDYISERLGHSLIQTTLRVYSYLLKDQCDKENKKQWKFSIIFDPSFFIILG